jgi:hypothetical protein
MATEEFGGVEIVRIVLMAEPMSIDRDDAAAGAQ